MMSKKTNKKATSRKNSKANAKPSKNGHVESPFAKLSALVLRALTRANKDKPVTRASLFKLANRALGNTLDAKLIRKHISDLIMWHLPRKKRVKITIHVVGEKPDEAFFAVVSERV
jgi:hypothetical protein